MAGATELLLTVAEGTEVLDRILHLDDVPQVIVSTGDLQARVAKWVNFENKAGVSSTKRDRPARHPRPDLAYACVPARDELEQRITEMWEKVLGIEPVGIHDDFFELGGHSLLATQLISRLRDAFQAEIPLRRMFETPTVAGIAQAIRSSQSEPVPPMAPTIPRASREGELPLSFGQHRLWFLDQLGPESPLYNNFAAVRISGPVDAGALEQCLSEIVRRHEILRTRFTEKEGRPVQVIEPDLQWSLARGDLSHLEGPQQEVELQKMAVQEARQPFRLSEAPLFRATLLSLGDCEHAFLLTMHHIISDGWSVRVLMNEIAAMYPALVAGQPSPLPSLPIQYADYAVWQRAWLTGERLEAQLAYWKRQLHNVSAGSDLTSDRVRPVIQTTVGATAWFDLPRSLAAALAALNQREGVTMFMTLLAALQILLYRYSGQEDFCIGAPIANRRPIETEGLIGFILNTLVMRSNLSGSPPVTELLHRVRETALEAYAHQDAPFEMLVGALQPQRDMSRSPFFQVVFDFQESPLAALNVSDLRLTPIRVDARTSKFDLALSVEQVESGLRGFFNYNTDLFDAETIQRMIGHFECLLHDMVAHPERPVSGLAILTENERRQSLFSWNEREAAERTAPLVVELFESRAREIPEKPAVIYGRSSLSYVEINRRANQLARHLNRSGVGPECLVGICLDRSPSMVISVLATLKAGGAILPLDPALPRERLAWMLEDARASALITQSQLADLLPPFENCTVVLDADAEAIDCENVDDPDIRMNPENLAYVIYTSGSTGKPKGVMIDHGTLAIHCNTVRRHFRILQSDRVLQFASLNFDPSFEQMFVTLGAGATLILRGDEIWTAPEFHAKIEEYGLTVVNVPPAYWHQWAEYIARGPQQMPDQGMKLVIVGGDVMRPESLLFWRQAPMKHVRLLNAYGPTETTITALTCEVPAESDDERRWPGIAVSGPRRIPIGRPLAGRKAYVLDRHGSPLPVGVAGELCIGGTGLARGYLGDPALTAQKFVPDPFSEGEGARLYRTGDMVHYRPDGSIEFVGRIDQQVKVRGFRIELQEIEAALDEHPGVRKAVVGMGNGTSAAGEIRLIAYVCPRDSVTPGADELKAFLALKLPSYMVPAVFVYLEELPLTPSGKVDRQALPDPGQACPAPSHEYVAPRSPLEADLAANFAEVLKIERVGIQDNFFDLGGHSLIATQLISRVREAYHIELPLRRLFESPTVTGLASAITESLAERENQANLAELLEELEQLPDGQVQELLRDEDRIAPKDILHE
jgi:amino acid adenylation domain-containing protein